MYDGPVIDAHHHLWELSGGRYPWLSAPDAGRRTRQYRGPSRCMFGSDYPFARRTMTYPALCERFREIAAEYSEAEHTLFHGTAARLNGITP
jgi:predicted TIM-barrel fold metal-dependent hydrolase